MDLSQLQNADLEMWIADVLSQDSLLSGKVNPPYLIRTGKIGSGLRHIRTADPGELKIGALEATQFGHLKECLQQYSTDKNLIRALHSVMLDDSSKSSTIVIGLQLQTALSEFGDRPAAILMSPFALHQYLPQPPLLPPLYKSPAVQGEDLLFVHGGNRVEYVLEPLVHIAREGPDVNVQIKVGVGKPHGKPLVRIKHFINA